MAKKSNPKKASASRKTDVSLSRERGLYTIYVSKMADGGRRWAIKGPGRAITTYSSSVSEMAMTGTATKYSAALKRLADK